MTPRQYEERRRLWTELKDRLGESDPLVAQWKSEIQGSTSFEVRYPVERRSRPRTVRPTATTRVASAIDIASLSAH
jgi:hypothetical protein